MLKIRSPKLEKKYPGQERKGGTVLNQSGAFSSLLRRPGNAREECTKAGVS